jgi:hypothetical protein
MADNSESNLGFSQLPFGKVIRDTTLEEQRASNSRGVQMITISKPFSQKEKLSEIKNQGIKDKSSE